MNQLLENKIILNNGTQIPQVGIGTYKITNAKELEDIIINGFKLGYRHIDTASRYQNEEMIGRAIQKSGIDRKDIFITSKIWVTEQKYEDTKQSLDEILKRLQTNYLDLCLIHWPSDDWKECYRALEEAYKTGKIMAIGVSNFNINHLEELEKTFEIMPTINQIELHVGFQQEELVGYCKEKNIAITSWSTLMHGKIFDIEELKVLCDKYNKNAAQIALRWAIDKNYIIIPKTSKSSRLSENIDILDFTLTEEDYDLLAKIPQKRLGPDPATHKF